MKTVFYFLTILVICFSFSGCAFKGEFNNDLISKEINPYINKVNKETIAIIYDKSVITKRSETWQGKAPLEMKTGEINNLIETTFFKQYFTVVNIVNEETKGIVVDSKILDYKYFINGFDNTDIEIDLKVTVKIDNKTILDKVYKIKENNKVIFRIGVVTGKESTIELFHKSLLNFYETEFKKDLIEALKSNK